MNPDVVGEEILENKHASKELSVRKEKREEQSNQEWLTVQTEEKFENVAEKVITFIL